MKNFLVSIIVPIYNVEQYVEKCVSSLLEQDHECIEIILVDDGSPDNSGCIIDRLSQADERIKVVHKENGGVSSARNAGLEIAQGDFVMFVDGDDYVDPDYVSYFLKMVLEFDCDIAMNTNNYTYKTKKQAFSKKVSVVSAYEAIEDIYLGKIFVAVWNKIYRRSFLIDNGIKFDTRFWYGEGMLFNILCLQYTEKIVVGEKRVYHQVYNSQSAMRNFNLESNHCGMRSLERQKELWIKKSKKIENAWAYHYLCFSQTILCGLMGAGLIQHHYNEYVQCKRNLFLQFRIPMAVDIGFKNKLIHFLIALSPSLMAHYSVTREKRLRKQLSVK